MFLCLHWVKSQDLWYIQSSGTCSAQWFQTWRTESRRRACLCPRHRSHATTWNCFYTHTHARPQKWIQSQQQRKTVQAFFPVCVNNDTPLLQARPLPPCFRSAVRKWKRKNRPLSLCKAKALTVQTAFIHGASLSCAALNPSLAWALSVSPSASLVPLAFLSSEG